MCRNLIGYTFNNRVNYLRKRRERGRIKIRIERPQESERNFLILRISIDH